MTLILIIDAGVAVFLFVGPSFILLYALMVKSPSGFYVTKVFIALGDCYPIVSMVGDRFFGRR